ncbi:hypothetical protein ACH5RR_022055 [Cinchona calisaya]|uniref:Uncharacterized protein n=1 Tax=Cinchona calisaya TaxID=153742 RepID=A0ABD2Z7S6_9GENT
MSSTQRLQTDDGSPLHDVTEYRKGYILESESHISQQHEAFAIEFHYVRHQVQDKQVVVTHIHVIDQLADTLTADQLADTHTKALKVTFNHHLFKLGIVAHHLSSGGILA